MTEQTDHDLLIRVAANVEWLIDYMKAHKAHHRQLLYIGIGFCITLVSAILLMGIR